MATSRPVAEPPTFLRRMPMTLAGVLSVVCHLNSRPTVRGGRIRVNPGRSVGHLYIGAQARRARFGIAQKPRKTNPSVTMPNKHRCNGRPSFGVPASDPGKRRGKISRVGTLVVALVALTLMGFRSRPQRPVPDSAAPTNQTTTKNHFSISLSPSLSVQAARQSRNETDLDSTSHTTVAGSMLSVSVGAA